MKATLLRRVVRPQQQDSAGSEPYLGQHVFGAVVGDDVSAELERVRAGVVELDVVVGLTALVDEDSFVVRDDLVEAELVSRELLTAAGGGEEEQRSERPDQPVTTSGSELSHRAVQLTFQHETCPYR